MEYILALSALLIGFLAAWFLSSKKLNEQRAVYEANEKNLSASQVEAEMQKSVTLETLRIKTEEIQHLQHELFISLLIWLFL